jgi:hypothetical protein
MVKMCNFHVMSVPQGREKNETEVISEELNPRMKATFGRQQEKTRASGGHNNASVPLLSCISVDYFFMRESDLATIFSGLCSTETKSSRKQPSLLKEISVLMHVKCGHVFSNVKNFHKEEGLCMFHVGLNIR